MKRIPWQWRSSQDVSFPFLTGNGFSTYCRWVLNYDGPRQNPERTTAANWYFCKTDYLERFFRQHAPATDFVLFTHNSDLPITSRHRRHADHPRLRAWMAQNLDLTHPKLHALPIGIANAGYAHGAIDALAREQQRQAGKSELFFAAYAVKNHPRERNACRLETGIEPLPALPYPEYLRRLAQSYFCISPRGNGIDCHRTWEALYLRTIPVVTRSRVTECHPELPMVVLARWADFKKLEFSPELYKKIWGSFDPVALRMDRYLARLRGLLALP